VERVAVLADQQDPVVRVQHDHARGEVREVDQPVDAGGAVRAGDDVVPDRDPVVLVRQPPRVPPPGPDRRWLRLALRGVAHAPIVAGPGGPGPAAGLRPYPSTDGGTRRGPGARPAGEPAAPRGADAARRPDSGQRRPRAVGEPVAADP